MSTAFIGDVIKCQGREIGKDWKRYGNVIVRLSGDRYDGMLAKVFLKPKEYALANACHLNSELVRFRGEVLTSLTFGTRIVNVTGFSSYKEWINRMGTK